MFTQSCPWVNVVRPDPTQPDPWVNPTHGQLCVCAYAFVPAWSIVCVYVGCLGNASSWISSSSQSDAVQSELRRESRRSQNGKLHNIETQLRSLFPAFLYRIILSFDQLSAASLIGQNAAT